MPTNIEKLAQELNALTDYDPMALECTEAVISEVPGSGASISTALRLASRNGHRAVVQAAAK